MLREMLSERELEELEKLIERVKEMNLHMPVVVEGKHDERALRNLGLKGEIILLNSGMDLVNFSDLIASKYREIILLLDWDSKGKENTKRLAELLEQLGVNVHLEVWEELQRKAYHVRTVESLIL